MNKKCIDQAERFLLLRDHNKKELFSKLQNKGFSADDIEQTLDYLEESKELSEARYVQSFVRSNNRRHPEGRILVLQRLAAKRTDRETAVQVVNEMYSEEYTDALVQLACAKLSKKGKNIDFTALSKLGFTSAEINRNIDKE